MQARKPNGKFGGKQPEITAVELYRTKLIWESEESTMEEPQPKQQAPMIFTEDQTVFLVSVGIVIGAMMGWILH
jgi:hypothetical protein